MNALLTLCSAVAILSAATSRKDISTETTLRTFQVAMMNLQTTCGFVPSEQQGLETLIRQPADWPTDVPWEPRFATMELPRDGWGNAYVYVRDANLPGGFGVYSCGRDGVTLTRGNDRDDLNTWNTARPWAEVYDGGQSTPLIATVLIVVLAILGVGAVIWIAVARRGRPIS